MGYPPNHPQYHVYDQWETSILGCPALGTARITNTIGSVQRATVDNGINQRPKTTDLTSMGETMMNTYYNPMVPLVPLTPRHALDVKVLRHVVVRMRSAAHAVYTAVHGFEGTGVPRALGTWDGD